VCLCVCNGVDWIVRFYIPPAVSCSAVSLGRPCRGLWSPFEHVADVEGEVAIASQAHHGGHSSTPEPTSWASGADLTGGRTSRDHLLIFTTLVVVESRSTPPRSKGVMKSADDHFQAAAEAGGDQLARSLVVPSRLRLVSTWSAQRNTTWPGPQYRLNRLPATDGVRAGARFGAGNGLATVRQRLSLALHCRWLVVRRVGRHCRGAAPRRRWPSVRAFQAAGPPGRGARR